MSNWFLKKICLFFVAVFILAGCEQKFEEDVDILAREPNMVTLSVPSDYAARAIKAAGGLDAWTKTKELQLNCVVTFYQPDGSYYLSEHSYEVYPWSNSIRISAQEPNGRFVWQLTRGKFDVLEGTLKIDSLPSEVGGHCFAEAILNVITTPARLLDKSVEFTEETNAVKIQGKWYYPIKRRNRIFLGLAERLSDAVFYQNRGNSLINMIWLACRMGDSYITVCGYDYERIEEYNIQFPMRIEIFSSDAQGNYLKQLVKIDCHAVGHK